MRGPHHRSTCRSVVAILSAVCFLAMSMGSVTRSVAADDTFETWPKKPAEPVVAPELVPDASGAGKTWEMWPIKRSEPVIEQTPGADGAARAGDATEKKTATGRSYGTIGWIALGIAAAIGIAVAAAGGGGGGGGTVTNPGHQ